MDKKVAAQIIHDHSVHGLSYRSLGKKYKMPHVRIYRLLMGKQKKQQQIKVLELIDEGLLPDDIDLLKEELRKARLKIELQDLMIDISSKELGIDLRKKHGTRQSK
jgi:hypothetical protein